VVTDAVAADYPLAELAAAGALLVAALAEWLHVRRCRRIGVLAFGPHGRPAAWARATPFARALAVAAVTWGLCTLLQAAPKVHKAKVLSERELKHVVLVLDVSPSMRLADAGPSKQQQRMHRARDVMESFFQRVTLEQFRLSVVATYNGAKALVVDTSDVEVVRNILGDLPLHFAFPVGKTDIFAGLVEAAKIAQPWPPKSTTVILVSDGDTVPATGMPKMPASVQNVLCVGVGDPVTGRFLDGRQSRQDRSTLRQVAVRLGGVYHDGNEKHLPSDILRAITATDDDAGFLKLTKREYALLAIAVGALLLAVLPVLLHWFGTRWRPGVNAAGVAAAAGGASRSAPDAA
jgi:Ca-activated chloride channel family protein